MRIDPATVDLPKGQLYIGGEWRAGTGAEITSLFPADRFVNKVFKGASKEDVLLAIDRAQAAAREPAWRDLKPHERAGHLYRIADGIARSADRISAIQSRDTGKTLSETRALAHERVGHIPLFRSGARDDGRRGDALARRLSHHFRA